MKLNGKRLVFVILICLLVLPASIAFGSYLNPGDPYELMYDSNQKLTDRIEQMPYFAEGPEKFDVADTPLDIADTSLDEDVTDKSLSDEMAGDQEIVVDQPDKDYPDLDIRANDEVKEQVLDYAKEGATDEIVQLDELPEDVKDQIEQIDQDVKEDRYIVKYRTEENGDLPALLKDNMDVASVDYSERTGNMELLVLDEKVNPKDLAETLQAAGVDDEIEYIQPDFKVYYAAEDAGDLVDPIIDETNDGSGEDELTEGEGTEPAEDPGSEEVDEEDPGTDDMNTGDPEDDPTIEEQTPVEEVFPEELLPEVVTSGVTVAVIDTGVDISHPGLVDSIWNNGDEIADDGIDNDGNGYIDDTDGWNFYDDDNQLYDSTSPLQSAHGTHVSGIIADKTEDYDVKIMPLKVFGENGAYTSDIIDAINYAEANGARVVNCSFGSTDNNLALKEAIQGSDMLFVCSVGNARSDLEETAIYPACFGLDNIISVTSTNADGGLSYYSNYSDQMVDVAALGRDVVSTLPDGEYGKQSGTSMSAAQVSGVAAAVMSVQNDLSANDLKQRLINTSDMLSNLQDTVIDGRQINLDQAVANEEQTEILENDPKEDFDVNGYNPTQDELYKLYANSGDVIQVASASSYSLVLKENGTVWAWGQNNYGQCGNGISSYTETIAQVIGLSGVVQIDASGYSCLAVKSDGTVWAWGSNSQGQLGDGTTTSRYAPVQVSGLTGVVQASLGSMHGLAVKADGTVWAWGYNGYGQLGDGTTISKKTPVRVSGLIDVVQVSEGTYFSSAVKLNGTVWAWGYNDRGQVGDGTTTTRKTPVQVSGLTNVVQIASENSHSLVVKSDGTAWAWGYNGYGQLGDGTWTDRLTPVQVSGLTGVVQVNAGGSCSFAVKSNGTVWSWGFNDHGQLGDGTRLNRYIPVQVSGLTGAVQVDASGLAVKSDGTVWGWGENTYGKLGEGTKVIRTTPVQVSGFSGVVQTAAGSSHSLILKSDGTVFACGNNGSGELGDGTTIDKSTPVQVSGLTGVVQVACGQDHSLAVKSDGTVRSWGWNYYGQLGDGTTVEKHTPVQVSGLTGVVQVVAGSGHNLALKSDGTVWAWGYNNYGQLGDGTTTTRKTAVQVNGLTNVIEVAAGESLSMAIKSDGTVWQWGNFNGTTNITPVQVSGLTDVVQVAIGYAHCLALKSDQTVWAWGNNGYGQLGDGTKTGRSTPVQVSGLTGIERVVAGYHQNLAVKTDGTVWAWGYNYCGQLGDGTNTDRLTPVQVSGLTNMEQVAEGQGGGQSSGSFSLAVKSDGTIWAWGNDYSGQLGLSRLLSSDIPIQAQVNHNIIINVNITRKNLAITEHNGKLYAIGGYNNNGYSGAIEEYNASTDAWTTKTPMPTGSGREGLGATTVDGKIYAIGGYDGYSYLNTVQEYDPTANTWTTKSNTGFTARTGLGVVAVNGKIYAIGGYDGTNYLNTVEEYDPATDTWSTRQGMTTARSDFAITEINGIIYAVGGRNGSGALTTVEAYDPVSDQWTTRTGLSTARYGLGVAQLNGQLIAIGGYNGSTYLSVAEAYNITTNVWTTKSGSLSPRAFYAAATLGEDIYLVGGENQSGYLENTELYDLGSITWGQLAVLPTGRSGLGSAVVDGKIYAVGGYLAGYKKTVEMYDPTTNTWATKTSMANARKDLGVVAVNGKVYAIGGYDGYSYLNTVQEYDPTANTWTTKSNTGFTARSGFGIAAVNGKIYVFGGRNGTTVLNTVKVYDPSTDTWAAKSNMPEARTDLSATAVNGKIYLIGGTNGTNVLNTVEEYDPVIDTWAQEAKANMPTARKCLNTVALNGKVYAIGGCSGTALYNVVEEYDPTTDSWTVKAALPNFNTSFGACVVNGKMYIVGGSPYINYTKILSGTLDESTVSSLATLLHLGENEVNLSGNFSRTYTDLSITSQGFSIDINRTYNSRDDRTDGPLGKGWTFGFQGSIKDYETNQKIVRLPNGRAMTFTLNGSEYEANDSRATLVKNIDNTFTLTTKDQYTYGFDTNGWLHTMQDRNGNTVTLTVNASTGYVTNIIDQVGRQINVSYNAQGHIDTVTDFSGRVVQYQYTDNLLTSVIDPMGNTTNYIYNDQDLISEIRDNDDNLIESVIYDDSAVDNNIRIARLTDANENTYTYMYDTDYRKMTVTDINNRETITWYDSSLYPVMEQYADGRRSTTLYSLDSNSNNKYGEIESYTDRNGNRTEYERDTNGNITKVYNPDSSFKEYGYDSKNNIIWEKDESGNYTFNVYDANSIKLLKKAQPLNGTDQYTSTSDDSDFAITTYAYYTDAEAQQLFNCNAKGLLKSETNPMGYITTYTYDEYGNLYQETNSQDNDTTTYNYNPIGLKTDETSPKQIDATYSYDSNRNVEKIIEGDNVTRITYDYMGRKEKEVSPNLYDSGLDDLVNHTYSGTECYSYTYYENNKIYTETDPNNNTTTYTYDIYGNTLTVTQPDGSGYIYDYDVLNRINSISFKESSVATPVVLESYDYLILENGNTKEIKTENLNGSETAVSSKTYDYAGRVVRRDNPDGTYSTNIYNANGTLASSTDNRGYTTYYTYDGLNRLTEQWTPAEIVGGAVKYTYTSTDYDKEGNTIEEKTGKSVVNLHDVPASFYVVDYEYNEDGTLKTKTDSSGRKTEYQYDSGGNLSREDVYTDATNMLTTEYVYDDNGQLTDKKVHVRQGDLSGQDFGSNQDTILTTHYTYEDGNLKTETRPDNVTITYTYDDMNNLICTSQPGQDEQGNSVTISTLKTYDWQGNVLTETDANNHTTTNTYDSRGQLTKVTDANGGVTAYYYDTAGRKTAEVLPKNYDAAKTLGQMNRTEYTYDSMGRLKTKSYTYIDPSTSQWVSYVAEAYKYDGNGNVVKKLDALGYESGSGSTVDAKINSGYGTTYTYNPANKQVTLLDPVSADRSLTFTTKYDYDALGRDLAFTDARGYVTAYTYDDAGNVLTTAVNNHITQTNTYDLLGNLLTQTDGNGNTTTYTYNAFGQMRTSVTPGDSSIPVNTTNCQYDSLGNLTKTIDSAGTIDLYTYDNQSRMTQSSQTKLNDDSQRIDILTIRYDKAGNKRYVTDGNGVTTEYTYDVLNRMHTSSLTVTDCNNNSTVETTTYAYDGNGNLTAKTDWLGNVSTNVYDPLDRLMQKINPLNITVETLEYNHNDAQIKSYDACGKLTQYTYDKNNRLLTTIDPCSHSVSQTYDDAGNKATKTDGDNKTTTYSYDEFNNLTSVVNALNQTTSYTYDLNGNMLTQTDGAGNVTTYEYNVMNLPLRKIDHGGRTGTPPNYTYDSAKTETYTYDAGGNLLTKVDRNGVTTTNTYDCHSRLLSTAAGAITISYTYDGNNNQLTMVDGTGTTTQTYDQLNRVKAKTVPSLGQSTYQYDMTTGLPSGQVKEIDIDPKSNVTAKVYDQAGRMISVSDGTNTTTYSYYDNGAKHITTYPDSSTETYAYYDDNTLYTLVNKKADQTVIDSYTYTYDGAHNMASKVDSRGTTSYTYDDLERLGTVTEPSGQVTTYTFDAAGNRSTETVAYQGNSTVTTYTYNTQNRLTGTETQLNNVTTQTVDYTYDNNGNELTITTTPYINGIPQTPSTNTNTFNTLNRMTSTAIQGGSTVTNTYNGEGLRVRKQVGANVLQYLYDGDKVVLECDSQNNQMAKNVWGTSLVSRNTGGSTGYYMYNGHGDVTALINSGGTILATDYYDSFGNILASTGTFNNPFKYAGYYYDSETGDYYLLARYYDPMAARFLSEDTYRGQYDDPLSLNLYTYCHNEPLMYTDPTGHNETAYYKGDKINLTNLWKKLANKNTKYIEYVTFNHIGARANKVQCLDGKPQNTGDYSCAGYVKRYYDRIYFVTVTNLLKNQTPIIKDYNGKVFNAYKRNKNDVNRGDILRETRDSGGHWGIVCGVERHGQIVTIIEQNMQSKPGTSAYAYTYIHRKIYTNKSAYAFFAVNKNQTYKSYHD